MDAKIEIRIDTKLKMSVVGLAQQKGLDLSNYIRLLLTEKTKESVKMRDLRKEIEVLMERYENLSDEIKVIKADGDLSNLCNSRSEFDRTFDIFFDNKELRTRYHAWDDDVNEPDFNYTNGDLESKLNDDDLKSYILFLKGYNAKLQDKLIELR